MPELFTVALEVGPDAELDSVAIVLHDLSIVAGAALQCAGLEAESQARRYLYDEIDRGGVERLIGLARQREIPAASDVGPDLFELEELWRYGPIPFGRRGRGWLASWLLAGNLRSSIGPAPASDLIAALVAAETARRLPDDRYRLRSFRYSNPATAEILASTGVAATGLAYLLTVIRSWSSRRRRDNARASAEQRIQRAHAADTESLVATKVELRRIMLERLARGEVSLDSAAIDTLLTADLVGAADRLADRDPQFQRLTLPSTGPDGS